MTTPTYEHLRVVETRSLVAYFERQNAVLDGDLAAFGEDRVLYHAYKPGFADLPSHWAAPVQRVIRGSSTSMPPELCRQLASLRWDEGVPASVESLVERTKIDFVALQNPVELTRFLRIVERRRPKTVVEIGTAGGGTLFALAQLAAPDATIVSIDFEGGPYGGGQSNEMVSVFRSFMQPRQRAEFIRDRSFHYSTLQDLRQIIGDDPIDLLFIDGDHSYGGVMSDYAMYQPLVAESGLTAFHDIVLEPEHWGRGADSGIAWRTIRDRHARTLEIFDTAASRRPPPTRPRSYEDMARHAWGIGVIFGQG